VHRECNVEVWDGKQVVLTRMHTNGLLHLCVCMFSVLDQSCQFLMVDIRDVSASLLVLHCASSVCRGFRA